jgi:hypothetical protein
MFARIDEIADCPSSADGHIDAVAIGSRQYPSGAVLGLLQVKPLRPHHSALPPRTKCRQHDELAVAREISGSVLLAMTWPEGNGWRMRAVISSRGHASGGLMVDVAVVLGMLVLQIACHLCRDA